MERTVSERSGRDVVKVQAHAYGKTGLLSRPLPTDSVSRHLFSACMIPTPWSVSHPDSVETK